MTYDRLFLDEKFAEQNRTLARIEIQSNKTNGRVTWMERMIWGATGALTIITPISFWLVTEAMNEQQQVQAIKATLAAQVSQSVEQGLNNRVGDVTQ